jgi:hypothetical protein
VCSSDLHQQDWQAAQVEKESGLTRRHGDTASWRNNYWAAERPPFLRSFIVAILRMILLALGFLCPVALRAETPAVESKPDTFAAQVAYDRGMKAFQDKSWIQAKFSLARCLRENPDFPKKKEILLLVAQAGNKIRTEISGEIDAPTMRSIQDDLESASKLAASGDHKKALELLRGALDKSPVLKEVRILLEEEIAKQAFLDHPPPPVTGGPKLDDKAPLPTPPGATGGVSPSAVSPSSGPGDVSSSGVTPSAGPGIDAPIPVTFPASLNNNRSRPFPGVKSQPYTR